MGATGAGHKPLPLAAPSSAPRRSYAETITFSFVRNRRFSVPPTFFETVSAPVLSWTGLWIPFIYNIPGSALTVLIFVMADGHRGETVRG